MVFLTLPLTVLELVLVLCPRAGKCLAGPLPDPGKDCAVCNYVPAREKLLTLMTPKAAAV